MLGRQGSIDDFRPIGWVGHEAFEGGTLRLHDRGREEWRIYWMSTASGELDAPMVGSFAGGTGTFYANETHEGKPVLCRFLWHGISEDRGTWETNWVMTFTRVS